MLGAGVGAVEGYSSLPSQRHVELYAETAQQPRLFDLWAEQVVLVPTSPSDAHSADGVPFRTDHPLLAGFGGAAPSALRVPSEVGPIAGVRLIGTLGYAYDVPQGTPVATLTVGDRTLPLRAGIELSERAFDRPSLRGLLAHQKARTAFDFEEATPEGEAYTAHLYQADLPLDPPVAAQRLTLTPLDPKVLVRSQGLSVLDSSGQTHALGLANLESLHAESAAVLVNDHALPRAFVLPKAQSFSPARHPGLTATQLVASPDMDVHRQVLIENDPTTPDHPGPPTSRRCPRAWSTLDPMPSRSSPHPMCRATWSSPTSITVAGLRTSTGDRVASSSPMRSSAPWRWTGPARGRVSVRAPLAFARGSGQSLTLAVALGLIVWGLRTRRT